MSTGNKKLHLLAYPLTTDLHGTVFLYRLPEHAQSAWDELVDRYRNATGSRGNLPYAGLATALRAAGHTSVNLYPTSRSRSPQLMISRHRLDPRDIRDAVAVWEQALLHVPDEQIKFSYPSKLADAISDIEPDQTLLSSHLTRQRAQSDAPDWVYDAATWHAAQQLAAQPWHVDGRTVTFRADTDGNLLVWDPDLLWSETWNARPGYAAMRIHLAMQTAPGMPTPVLVVDPAVSRLSRWLNSSRHGWLAQRSADHPLLTLGLEGYGPQTHIERTSEIALSVWGKLRGENLIRPEDRDLSGTPGRLRVLIPNSVRFPVGRGVGMYSVRELSQHVAAVLGADNLYARNVVAHTFASRRKLTAGRDSELLDEAMLPAVVEASGCQRLRIVVLYSHQHTRGRLQRLLAYHFNRPDLAETGFPEDQLLILGERVEIVFHHADELLAHGDHAGRDRLAAKVTHLDAPDSTHVLTLCETEYDEQEWAKRRRDARRRGSTTIDPDKIDAKHPLNRLLARRRVLAQFITTQSAPTTDAKPATRRTIEAGDDEGAPQGTDTPSESTDKDPLTALGESLAADHEGHSAVADLLRAAGLVHPRLGDALSHGKTHGLTEPIAFVGLHVREQRAAQWTSAGPRLSWALVALIPDGRHWHAKAYQARRHPRGGATGWQDYFTANTAFRAHPFPEGTRRDRDLVDSIDAALGQLTAHLTTCNGYVVMISGDVRTLYPGSANKNTEREPDSAGLIDGQPALPGYSPSLPQRPRAVVRITSGSRKLPRPVEVRSQRTTTSEADAQPQQKVHITKTTKGLYQLDGARNTWILANVPRQFSGGKRYSRAGENSTRWSADSAANKQTWYAHTATEITVLTCDGTPERYAVAAARLCDHAISWDGRTSYPAPNHLAAKMDRDHPEYRRTVTTNDEVDIDDLVDE